MPLTPEAKKLLAETIRGTQHDPGKGLRAKLLRAIHDEADRRYRLSVERIGEAGLDEANRKRRERIEAWIDEHARATKPKNAKELRETKERLLAQAEKEAAATLINRLVLLRQLEAAGLSKPPVVTGGWSSKGYRDFREFAPTLCTNGTADATEGYATLLQLLFDELSVELPGLYGDVGLTRLFAVPPATLREVIERLDDPELESAWRDDTTLGWVYQYWNDPDREALDAKVNPKTRWGSGKIESHEIASKTQMFTERYMVEWLLQNGLGPVWLALCKKRGWTADAENVLPLLDERRAKWREGREAGEVALDALMPIESELEDHWKYYVPQPIPEDAVVKAPDSVRTLKILDPACGSGHFLVIAFDLLAALYREEARHRGQAMSDRDIAESILEQNLYGIDIDPRAIQIAAAGLYLKCKALAKDARPKVLNLVAPTLQLGDLPADDPAVAHLREDLKRETGIPGELTDKLVKALAGVDYLGSLLKVDAAVEAALRNAELEFERTHGQGDFFGGYPAQQVKLTVDAARATVLTKLELFLVKHSKSEDLGLRLDGEQLASGVRFTRIAKDGMYDIVLANPPYHGIKKMGRDLASALKRSSPKTKADLYAAFMLRAAEFAKPEGTIGVVALRNWMFANQLAPVRAALASTTHLRLLADLHFGAFSEGKDVSVAMFVASAAPRLDADTLFLQPVPEESIARDTLQPTRNQAGLLAHSGLISHRVADFAMVPGRPMVYRWSSEYLEQYAQLPKLGNEAPVRYGAITGDNVRFVRFVWEVKRDDVMSVRCNTSLTVLPDTPWVPYVKGAEGAAWLEPLIDVVRWRNCGLEMKVRNDFHFGSYSRLIQNERWYFVPGVAFTTLGRSFAARAHRYRSIIAQMGSSVFPASIAQTLCGMNSARSREVLVSLNPGLHFDVGDVNRLPVVRIGGAENILRTVDRAFSIHEAAREGSLEFVSPAPSPWRYAQEWAQRAVDRETGEPQPTYVEESDPHSVEDSISFEVGVALGRFRGIAHDDQSSRDTKSLPYGLLFVSCEANDCLSVTESESLRRAWSMRGALAESDGGPRDLSGYLRRSFVVEHLVRYEHRPIYFPLSSAKKSFVAFASIHRWQDDTLNVLLADHLVPTRRRLEGELEDLRTARASSNNKGKAEKRFVEVQKLLEELNEFIAKVTEIAENGPPPSDDKTPKREVSAKYAMDLDDGVMVNSAALWPLLEPQWKDPKKWWKELATAQGKKDYDWSHLAARYFPKRVLTKCHEDPSLAVAHRCFWELHPAKAYAWELRLQDEIKPDFTIDEPGSDAARAKFLAEHESEAKKLCADEMKRRERKAAKEDAEQESDQPLLDRADNEDADGGDDE